MYTTYLQKISRRLLSFLCLFVLVWCGSSAQNQTQLKTGLALYDQWNLEQAAAVFEELSAKKNPPAETLYYLSMVNLATGDLLSARANIELFVQEYPNQLDARVTQAYIYYLDNDASKGKEILENVLSVDDTHEQALLYISLIDIEQADYALAEPHLQSLIDMHPENHEYLYLIGSMYSDRWFEAADTSYTQKWLTHLYQAYLKNKDDRDVQTYIWMSLNDLMLYDKAARVLAVVVQENPTYTQSMVHFAASLRWAGREEQSIVVYQKVLELDPSNVMASLELKKLWQEVTQIAYATQSASRMTARELAWRDISRVWKVPVLVRIEDQE